MSSSSARRCVRAVARWRARSHARPARRRSTCWRSRSSPSRAAEEWGEDELFALMRRAYPYRDLTRDEFDAVRRRCSARAIATRRGRRAALTASR